MEDLQRLYQTIVLDHGKKPRNVGRIDNPDREALANNRLCGDRFTLSLALDGDIISNAMIDGEGCAISTASASLMTELVKGKSLETAARLFKAFDAMMQDKAVENHGIEAEMEQLEALGGVRDFPNRVKCATLAWHGLDAALQGHEDEITTE